MRIDIRLVADIIIIATLCVIFGGMAFIEYRRKKRVSVLKVALYVVSTIIGFFLFRPMIPRPKAAQFKQRYEHRQRVLQLRRQQEAAKRELRLRQRLREDEMRSDATQR